MLYRDTVLLGLAALCSTALGSPLEVRAPASGTVAVLQHLAKDKPLAWQSRKGGKLQVLRVPKGQWAAAEAAVGGHKRRAFEDDAATPAAANAVLAPRQGETVSSMHTNCYGSGSWAYDKDLIPLITSICDEGAYSWTLDAGSAQVLHFLGMTNEKGDQMSVYVTLKNLVDGIYSGVDPSACEEMAKAQILQGCQGKNADTRGGWTTARNLQGQDAVSLAIDPTTDKCNC